MTFPGVERSSLEILNLFPNASIIFESKDSMKMTTSTAINNNQ
jgi:hypothetical protein